MKKQKDIVKKWNTDLSRILCLVFFVFFVSQCSSTGSVIVPIDKKTIDTIVNDPEIPDKVKTRILTRFQDVNNQAIEVIGKRNLDLQSELKELNERIEKDRWKVDLVNFAIKFFWIVVFLCVLYFGIRFRRLLGF